MKKITLFLLFISHLLGASELEKVSLQLKWKHQFQSAGFIASVEKGFYRDVGLDVKLIEFNSSKNIIDDITGGEIEFGVSDSSLVLERMKSKPLVVMMAIFQQSPFVLLALKSSNIKNLKDINGKKIALYENSHGITIKAMLKSNQINYYVEPSTSTLDKIIDKEADMTMAYLSNEPFIAKERGLEVITFDPKDYGFSGYGDILFCSEEIIQKSPEMVQRFYEATLKGWKYTFSHMDEMVDLIHDRYNTLNKSKNALRYEAEILKKFSGYGKNFGELNEEKIKAISQVFNFMIEENYSFDYINGFIYIPKSKLNINFTKKELNFIKENRDIRIAMTENFIPFIFKKEDKYQGFNIDILNKISKISGLNFKVETDSWANSFKSFKEGRVDMISSISYTKKRVAFTLYTKPYYEIPTFIFGKKSDTYYKNIESLKGKKVGIVKNMFYKDILKKAGIKVIEYENNNEKAKALAFGNIDYFLSNFISGNRAIISQSLTNIEPIDEFTDIKREDLRFGINKNSPTLHSIIQKSLNQISDEEYESLKHKWIVKLKVLEANSLHLIKDELAYLKNKKEIKMCVDPNWMPLEKIDKDGEYIGILSEYIKNFSNKLNMKFSLEKTISYKQSREYLTLGRCDIIVGDVATNRVKKVFLTSKPYFTTPRVFALHIDTKGVQNFSQIVKDGKVGVLLNSPAESILKESYKNIDIVSFKSMKEGLNAVSTKEVIAYVGTLSAIAYNIQLNSFLNVKITGTFKSDVELSILINKDLPRLVSILNKTIDNISENERIEILNRWIKVTYEEEVTYKYLWIIITVSIFFILIAFVLNLYLRKKIKIEVKKNRQQQLMLFEQSRLAQMGEMISMIAHQWRQPLSSINASIMEMDIKISKSDCKDRFILEKEFSEIELTTKYMSDTIDDFRDFFKPKKNKVEFSIEEVIEHAIRLVQGSLTSAEINIYRDYESDISLVGYPNEIGQVIVNIMNNAKDILILNNQNQDKNIYIHLYKESTEIFITIQNNGGDIDNEIIDYIFDPYFSTKFKKNGTGLGLYIAKMIIEEHMDGHLSVKNTDVGAIFTIGFPLR